MDYLHKNEVAHRDLKAENVIVTNEGVLKLLDFGLAKEGMISEIFGNSKVGTLCYRAPEFYDTV